MWAQFLNQSRSQRKYENRPLIILGNKHSGKRSIIHSLFDISKTTVTTKRVSSLTEANKMRLKGTATAIDYAYLNVIDINDPDNRTHTKLEMYMVQEIDSPQVYNQLAKPEILKNAIIVIMVDFTNPWNFIADLQKWTNFVYQLQKMAQMPIGDLENMAEKLQVFYKKFKEPEFDENGKLKTILTFDKQKEEEELSIPLPEGVLSNNIRIPLLVCVNKCDLQSQVLRDESANKLVMILYHLRNFCVKYGASLLYTSIKNNCNLNVLYEYILHRAYTMPLRFKSQAINEEAIFIPFGYDNPELINASVVKIDVTKSYNEVIPIPPQKKATREEIMVEEDSKFFEKYINQAQTSSLTTTSFNSEKESEKPQEKRQAQVTDFFKNLLSGKNKPETATKSPEQTQRMQNVKQDLAKHTTQVIQKGQ